MSKVFKVTFYTEKEYLSVESEGTTDNTTLEDVAKSASDLLEESDFIGETTKDGKRFVAIRTSDIKKIVIEENEKGEK